MSLCICKVSQAMTVHPHCTHKKSKSDTCISRDRGAICPISGETIHEERINYLTHLLGLVLSFIGGIILFWSSLSGDDVIGIISCCAYVVTLIGLYAASTFYHRCKTPCRKRTWKIADHSFIYLLIAGSYTPFALGPLRNLNGLNMFVLVWVITALGITFKIFAIDRFKRISLISYLGLGWLIAFSLPALSEAIPSSTLTWLIIGGLAYTFGTVFYAWKSLLYSHAIWHIFVLTGSSCHYYSILSLLQI